MGANRACANAGVVVGYLVGRTFVTFASTNEIITPGNISVSSKHVQALCYYCDCVVFSITSDVERTGSPAVSGGAVTQHPLSVILNHRC